MSSLADMETMDRPRHLTKTTIVLSLLLILFGTVGVHLIYPALGHYGHRHAPLAYGCTQSGSEIISSERSGECLICQFLISFQLCGESSPAQKARFRPVCEVPNLPVVGFSQRICFLLFDARAGPLLIPYTLLSGNPL